jgi:phenylacetate-CoA ligase
MGFGWSGLKERLYQRAFNRRFFDAFHLSEGNIADYARSIARYRPDVLVGYVAPVVELARWMKHNGFRIPGLRSVVTGAEALFEPERKEIQEAFGCLAFNTYGAREFMLIASECERHAGLHVNADHLVVETVGPGGRAVNEGPGEVLITDLHNLAMPLVRYRNGDSATPSTKGPCACGRGLPLLQCIDGRILDLIVTPDGRHVPGEYIVYCMLGRTLVRRYQAVQVAPDELEVRMVTEGTLPMADRERIIADLAKVVGPSMRIRVIDVDAIPETGSGKRRVTVSLESHRAATRGE